MKPQLSPRRPGTLMLALLLATGGAAWAQTDTGGHSGTTGSMQSGHGDMGGTMGMHRNMMGMHSMPATVDSVDRTSGLVGVTSAGMTLKLHFPSSALADLRAGDRITLYMGFTKP